MGINFITLQPSFIEWPDYPTVQIFTFGCNWRCRYCFQRDAVIKQTSSMTKEEVMERLKYYHHKFDIDHAEIIGGEPTIWENDLVIFARELKKMGYKTQLATNGSNYKILKALLPYIDRVAMDYKTSLELYSNLIQRSFNKKTYIKSLSLLHRFPDYVVRTVYIRDYHTEKLLKEMIQLLNQVKIPYSKWELHPSTYNTFNLDPEFKFESSSDVEVEQIRKSLKGEFKYE